MFHSVLEVVILNENEVGREVTQREPQHCQDIPREVVHVSILGRCVPVEDVEDKGEHDNQYCEEEQEDLEVDHDVYDHGHDVAERFEYSHEKECLNQQQEDHDDQNSLGQNAAGADSDLQDQVCVAQTDVQDVHVVPRVAEVLLALLQHLGAVVEKRVDQTHGLDVQQVYRSELTELGVALLFEPVLLVQMVLDFFMGHAKPYFGRD